MLSNAAQWVAEECAAFGIPLVGTNANGTGVLQHSDLGSAGGGHWDCGSSFPIARVLEMAGGAPGASVPAPPPSSGTAPPFPGTVLVNFTSGHGTATWQGQMVARGWALGVDDLYGGDSESVCRQFQAEKGLEVDGAVGPITWDAAWSAPVT
jgi:peptidoglycan hydrolase-like protein with peptidoglycan-binding domain